MPHRALGRVACCFLVLRAVYTNLVLDVPNVQFLWPALVQITGYEDAFHKRFKHANERNVVQFLLDDPRC